MRNEFTGITGRVSLLLAMLLLLTLPQQASSQDGLFDDALPSSPSPGPGDATTGGDSLFGGDPAQPSQEELQQQYNEKLSNAQTLLQQKDWAGALALYEEVRGMTASPDPRVALGTGICHAELGSPDLAITALSQALVVGGQVPGLADTANLYLGRMYLETARYREALQKLTDVRQNNPTSAEANMLYGKATLRVALTTPTSGAMGAAAQAQLSAAVDALTQAIRADSEYGEAYLERGRALLRTRRFDFAVEDLQRATQLMGPTSDAGADLAVAYLSRSNQEGARPNGNPTKVTDDLQSAVRSMDAFLASAQLGSRVAPWENSDPLTQTPEDVTLSRIDARLELAKDASAAEREAIYAASLGDADKILRLETVSEEKRARAHYLRGSVLRMKLQWDDAIDELTSAIDIYRAGGDSYPDANLRRGICFYHQGNLKMAVKDFEAASTSRLNPLGMDARALMWLGIALADQGEYNTAIRNYTRAIRFAPRYKTAYMNRGLAYLNVGRYERAADDFAEVLQQDPSNQQAASYRQLALQSIQ